MALGYALPKVNFINITLDGGTDLLKKTDEPHILQEGETSIVSADITNPSQSDEENVDTMSVELIISIEVAFNQTSQNMYSVFFNNDFIKYLKIRAIQSTNATSTSELINNSQENSIFLPSNEIELQSKSGIEIKNIDFSSYDGAIPEKDPSLANQIEVKINNNGEKVYCIPYKLRFEIPPILGGVKANHLAYFLVSYIDLKDLLLNETSLGAIGDISLPDSVVNNITLGPLSSQIVIQGGTINNFSQIFYVTPINNSGIPTGFPKKTNSSSLRRNMISTTADPSEARRISLEVNRQAIQNLDQQDERPQNANGETPPSVEIMTDIRRGNSIIVNRRRSATH